MACLKHMYIDCEFVFNDEYAKALTNFTITLDTHPFLKSFDYEVDFENGGLIIRSSYQNLAIFSMMILGSGSAVQFMNHPGTFLTCDTLIPLDNKQGPPSPRSVSPVSDSI